MVVTYLMYNSTMGIYEFEVGSNYLVLETREYQIIYLMESDVLVLRLRKLGHYINMYDAGEFLDIEVRDVPTPLLDAIEHLIKSSVVIKEVRTYED